MARRVPPGESPFPQVRPRPGKFPGSLEKSKVSVIYAEDLRVGRVPIYLDVPDISVAHKLSRRNNDIFVENKKIPRQVVARVENRDGPAEKARKPKPRRDDLTRQVDAKFKKLRAYC